MNTIPIFIACDDNYAKYAAVVVKSVAENCAAPLYFGILCDSLTEENKTKLLATAGKNRLEFLNVDSRQFDAFNVSWYLKYITKETCFRYLIPEIKPEFDKAIYLDCDVVCIDDISKLFAYDISDVYAGVIPDSKDSDYFIAGVILINSKKCREDKIGIRLFERTKQLNGVSRFLDQDVLNDVYVRKVKKLPARWQIVPLFFNKKYGFDDGELESMLDNAGIVHLCGPDKPWTAPFGMTANPYACAFFHYLRQTPYAEKETEIKEKFVPVLAFLKMAWRNPAFLFKRQFWIRRKYAKIISKRYGK